MRKKINVLSSLFSRDSLCRKPRRQVFSRRGLCCLLDSSRTSTSSATDSNIKNIYNEEESQYLIALYIVFVTTAHRAGALIFCLQVSGMTTSADPEGGQGVRTPLGKSQVIWVSTGNKQQFDSPPPWKKLDPAGKCWTPSGNLKNDRFLRN